MKRTLPRMLCCILAFLCIFNVLTPSVMSAEIEEQTHISPADDRENYPYLVMKGTRYYQSADYGGFGRYGIVNADNIFVVPACYETVDGVNTYAGCYAGKDGYAFLDENRRIISFDYQPGVADIEVPEAPEGTKEVFYHFHTSSFRNGWAHEEDFIDLRSYSDPDDSDKLNTGEENTPTEPAATEPTAPPEEQSPEDVARDIVAATTSLKTSVILDCSGSMDDNQREVLEFLSTSEFGSDTNTRFFVFATPCKETTSSNILDRNHFGLFEYGTNLFSAINQVIEEFQDCEQIILVSDLETQDSSLKLSPSTTLQYVKVYDPDNSHSDNTILSLMEKAWGIDVTRTLILPTED